MANRRICSLGPLARVSDERARGNTVRHDLCCGLRTTVKASITVKTPANLHFALST